MIRRRLLTVAAVVSLLVFVATAGLWISTARWEMFVGHTSMRGGGAEWHWHEWSLWSRDAGLFLKSDQFVVGNPRFADQWGEKPGEWFHTMQPLGTSGPQMGYPANLRPFGYSLNTGPRSGWAQIRSRHFICGYLPYWCILVVSLPFPTVMAIRRQRHSRRVNRHLCLHCGYSLTGNTSGICPECGTPVPQQSEVIR